MAYGRILQILRTVMEDKELQKHKKLVGDVLTAACFATPSPMTEKTLKKITKKWGMSRKTAIDVIGEDLKFIKESAKKLRKRHGEVKGSANNFKEPIGQTINCAEWLEYDLDKLKRH